MRNRLSSALCATTLLIAGVGMVALPQPAVAQVGVRIGFDFFRDRLAGEGRWIRHPIWGDVWRPRPSLVGADFQPYSNGYWEYTDDYGWYWMSNDPFDDVVYHYGRWVYDPQWNWLWVPGYTWSPAWVVWREGDDYTGWMPMPPDEDFVSDAGLRFGVNLGSIGINFYDRWYGGRVDPDRFFVFVDNRHIVERDYRRFRVPRDRVKIVINRTRPVGKFEVVNNRVVNRGIDVRVVERATGRRITPVAAKTVIKPNAVITTVSEAKQIRQRERVAHPIDVNAVRRGNAGGAMDKNGAGGGNAAGEAGINPPDNQGNRRGRGNNPSGAMGGPQNGGGAVTAPEGGTNTQAGSRMRNPGGETMGGPSDETTGRSRVRRTPNNNTDAGESTNGPDQTGAGPSANPENPSVRRHRPGGTTASPDQTTPAGTGASGNTGEMSTGNNPRRRNSNAGSMSGPNGTMSGPNATTGGPNATTGGPNATTGGNGSRGMQGGSMNGPSAGNAAAQPGNSATEQKKKRKPKPSQEQDQGSPE